MVKAGFERVDQSARFQLFQSGDGDRDGESALGGGFAWSKSAVEKIGKAIELTNQSEFQIGGTTIMLIVTEEA